MKREHANRPRSLLGICLMSLAAGAGLQGCAGTFGLTETAGQCDLRPVAERQQQPVQGPALVPEVPGSMEPMPLNAVNLTDHKIVRKVVVQEVRGMRTSTGALQANARIVNCTDHDLVLEGRTRFMNADQVEVEPVSAWQKVFLPARSLGSYSSLSTSLDAGQFLIEVREVR